MRTSTNSRSSLAVCLLLAAAVAAVYWQTTGFRFVNIDDPSYVTGNYFVRQGLTWESVMWAFVATHSANWHPLTWISHMADAQVYGLWPGGHHLTNVVFHTINSVLLFLLLSWVTGFVWRSAFVAGLFALHPLHVESVAWVSERKDVLSTLFWLLTMLAYAWYAGARPLGVGAGFQIPPQQKRRRYILTAFIFALGLMTKPMLVTLPVVLLLLDVWPLGRLKRNSDLRRLVLEKAPLFVLAAGSGVVTLIVQRSFGATVSLESFPLIVRAANALVSYVGYIGKMLYPANLSAFYPHPRTAVAPWQPLAAGGALLLATYLAVRVAGRRPYLTVGWLWYLVTLVPVIGLVQVGNQAMADRYTYVPLIGIFIILSWGAAELAVRLAPAKMMAAGAVLVLAALAVCSWMQAGAWRSGVTLFERALASTGGHHTLRYLLADAYLRAGRPAQAEGQLRAALSRKSSFAEAHSRLGAVLIRLGRAQEAERELRLALELEPDLASAHYTLAGMLAGQGRSDQAIRLYRKVLDLDPRSADAHANLAAVLDRGGRTMEAIPHYKAAIRIKPDLAAAHFGLGAALARSGDMDQALEHLSKAVEFRPRWGLARYNLAVVHYRREEYASALQELTAATRCGYKPDPRFVRALESRAARPR